MLFEEQEWERVAYCKGGDQQAGVTAATAHSLLQLSTAVSDGCCEKYAHPNETKTKPPGGWLGIALQR
jgi:hypothetical protein